jgi:tRNA modification GTPase
MYGDTIAAISTPLGEGGIGIVRISGGKALSIMESIFNGRVGDRCLTYGHICDPATGERVDEVLAVYMAAPRTYTREDVVEINCHGGPMPLHRVLQLVLRMGARAAQPGEFTLRAFVNGRIDLAQAEAVLDMIQARTEASQRMALCGLEGRLSAAIGDIRAVLLSALASLTAGIDFPEDDLTSEDIAGPLSEALEQLRELIKGSDTGVVYRQGVRTAIVGRPNVGKSSLLNRLLRQDRSIVTSQPGTTRDTIEEVVNIQGVAFILVDTAGITEGGSPADSLAVERSRKAVQQADLMLIVIDGSEPIKEADREIVGLAEGKASLLVVNKCDLPQRARLDDLAGYEVVSISALSGEGVDQLEGRMVKSALGGNVVVPEVPLVGNPRHRNALERAEEHLCKALQDIAQGMADDFVTINLTAAIEALGEITGETVGEELLETIFANFCVGK